MNQTNGNRTQGRAQRTAPEPHRAQGTAQGQRRAQWSAPEPRRGQWSAQEQRRSQRPAQRPSTEQHYAHSLTPEQRRHILEMRRRQRRKRQLMIAVPAAVALIAVVAVSLSFALRGRGSDAADAVPEGEVASAMVLAAGDDSEETAGADGEALPDGETASDGEALPEGEAAPDGEAASDGTGAVDGTSPSAAAGAAGAGTSAEYSPAGGVFVYDDAYAAATQGKSTGPLIEPDMTKVDASKLNRWPKITQGYMPVTYGADNVQEKVIAITVDDCFQANNLRRIVQCALDNNGQLTIFPIGKNLQDSSVAENIKWAWENGMEIENHTYNHVGMYHYGDERMMKELWAQSKLLNQVLGVNYQEHFFRPKGGDERNDQRMHACVHQMGMSAVAIWGFTGSLSNMTAISSALKPGQVYLFHTTNQDMDLLLEFIPYAVQQGYRLVTLNELFGLPSNETSALTEPGEVPALQPFQIKTAYMQKTTYIRAAAVVQKRLIELGWLEGDVDGVFGESSYMATGYFQIAADLKVDGKAGEMTQAALFADDAPAATEENRAKVEAKIAEKKK